MNYLRILEVDIVKAIYHFNTKKLTIQEFNIVGKFPQVESKT